MGRKLNFMGVGFFWVKLVYMPVFCIVGGFIYAIQGWGGVLVLPFWAAHYVNDFLCMPIVLFVCRYAVRILKSDKQLNLTIPPILSLTLFYSLYFEVYLPMDNERYTADLLDVVLYFLGAAFFYLVENINDDTIGSKASCG